MHFLGGPVKVFKKIIYSFKGKMKMRWLIFSSFCNYRKVIKINIYLYFVLLVYFWGIFLKKLKSILINYFSEKLEYFLFGGAQVCSKLLSYHVNLFAQKRDNSCSAVQNWFEQV